MRKLLWSLLAAAMSVTSIAAVAAGIAPERQAELIYLLRQDCGSCHGMRLSGGLGPALLPERMRHWDVQLLAATILQGRPGTPMPPWRPFLTEQEALWLAAQLKRGIQP